MVVAYTLLGDANCDGTVNGTDLDLLAENWGTDATTWAQGDFYDCPALHGQDPGSIGAPEPRSDLTYLKSNFGRPWLLRRPRSLGSAGSAAGPITDNTAQFVVTFSGGASGVTSSDFSLTGTVSAGTP